MSRILMSVTGSFGLGSVLIEERVLYARRNCGNIIDGDEISSREYSPTGAL
jgi:hypothetical protein